MSPEEFKEAMENIDDHFSDPEFLHVKMDELMCKTLRSLGYGEGVDIFEKARKWYA